MLLRIAAGTGNDSVFHAPLVFPVSSTCPTKALNTFLLGQSTYICTAPNQVGLGCCVGRKKSMEKVVPRLCVSSNTWLLRVTNPWAARAIEDSPSVWRA